jgi:hypothetical protein
MYFIWFPEQTTILSVYNINQFTFVTKTKCVYCAVGTECFIIILINIGLQRVNRSTLHTVKVTSVVPYGMECNAKIFIM